MNASTNSRLLNSILPSKNVPKSSLGLMSLLIFVVALAVFGAIFYFYWDDIQALWDNAFSPAPAPAPEPEPEVEVDVSDNNVPTPESQKIVENTLPGNSEVYNISSNKYTYYDAEPLCKALGAELATYEQVKDAWSKGADWCNYGWSKGQMAVYPTSEETYAKLQKGPAEQHMSCGRAGVNGGFFDNPELRYGVNCYGPKPAQKPHDVQIAPKATPTSPDALEFDKKVAHFKLEADTIGILPFNGNKWD